MSSPKSAADEAVPAALLVTVPEAAKILGIGRTKVFQLIKRGALQSVKIDGSRRVVTSSLEIYAAHLVAQIH
jgi:excisionase family DNA binding protein